VLRISNSKDYFVRDGEKFFYLADTAWSAFTNASLDDWRYYLENRGSQGSNSVQINNLHQHDKRESDLHLEPFEVTPSGGWNFTKVNEAYFDRAEKMVEMAVESGFVPALVVLWCNYVKGTWGSKLTPSKIIPLELIESYVEYIVERFSKYNPIFVVSGDPSFDTDEAVKYYLTALEIVKKRAPHCLTTMHLAGGVVIPEPFVHSPYLDFYMYQSSHWKDKQFLPTNLRRDSISCQLRGLLSMGSLATRVWGTLKGGMGGLQDSMLGRLSGKAFYQVQKPVQLMVL